MQQLPTLTWNAVRGAAKYEYQISGDPRFSSLVGSGLGRRSNTHNLAAAFEKEVPDGTYYWRVRGLTGKDAVGSWSRTRRIVKHWSIAPTLTGGNNTEVSWPSNPLVLRWSWVPYATKYIVAIATDPALSNIIDRIGSKPVETQGLNYALPDSLAPGPYFWAITPLDAEGHPGVRSAVGSFQWSWPTSTTTTVTDLNSDPRVFDPLFSWNPIPGAAHYEVEVNSAEGFPSGSKWCCSSTTTGTSLAPPQVLANNRYYWRVRAFDARGDAGIWNYGTPFTKGFDSVEPSVSSLAVRSPTGEALSGIPSTDSPIVTWDPVPGASRYEVQVVPHNPLGCDWSRVAIDGPAYQTETSTTAWTPLGSAGHVGPTAWPNPERTTPLATGTEYCFRVLARSDNDAQIRQVVSNWTQLNGLEEAAFTYVAPPPPEEPAKPFVTPAEAYIQPAAGTTTPRTPLFTWRPVNGALGYYVVIARDAEFTEVADVGYTNVPAYAPRLANQAPFSDETTSYYWAVIPTTGPTGSGAFSVPQQDHPQTFNKSSAPPNPLAPGAGADVSTQPTFRWSAAENARNYHLQVSQDPTFGRPIDDVTTDATAYTSSSTYPADTAIYWRVRANDWNGQGLNWSPTETFVRRLPRPIPTSNLASGGLATTPLTWTAVEGAVSYDVRIDQGDGNVRESSVQAPSGSSTEWYGTGFAYWQVRAEFPTGLGGKTPGPFSALQPILLTLPAPTGARGVKAGSRIVLRWDPEPQAKRYKVELATTNGFRSTIDSHIVDGTSWAPDIDFSLKKNRGALYWRVAPVDTRGQVGSFAIGSFGVARPACTRPTKTRAKHGKRVAGCPKSTGKKPTKRHR